MTMLDLIEIVYVVSNQSYNNCMYIVNITIKIIMQNTFYLNNYLYLSFIIFAIFDNKYNKDKI